MDGQINIDFTVEAYFDNLGDPITGKAANFTVTVTDVGTRATVAIGSISESPASSGYYQATIDAAQLTGRRRLKAVWSNPTDQLYAEAFYDIGQIPTGARTRREIRQRVARRLFGDRRVWDEEATGGSTTTAIVPALTVGGDGEWRGYWAVFADGANERQQRMVTGFDAATDTLTVAPALPAVVGSDHRVELYPIRPTTIDTAINDALAALAEVYQVDADDQSLLTNGTTTEWALPADALYVCEVGLVRLADGVFLGWLPREGWHLLPGRKVRIGQGLGSSQDDPLNWGLVGAAALPTGSALRLWLRCAPSPPLHDESAVAAPTEAVVAQAAYQLLLDGPDEADRARLPHYRAEATREAARGWTAAPGAGRRVVA